MKATYKVVFVGGSCAYVPARNASEAREEAQARHPNRVVRSCELTKSSSEHPGTRRVNN